MLPDLKNTAHVVGMNQVIRSVLSGKVRYVYLADDADAHIVKQIIAACAEHNVEVKSAPSKAELGRAGGIGTAAAAVGVLK